MYVVVNSLLCFMRIKFSFNVYKIYNKSMNYNSNNFFVLSNRVKNFF